eukprot:NODE_1328_length_1778_cov_119.702719_g1261_i0.p1 GENE.NODE_1328_length_1778_cov_119.702719_g1261_i0~~NODE_1328_length_1778_cov_119.702719_g1261_i0.p1  ORF type:complete len:549 (-),score=33.44 NODE_1328_length_1778_cov_119.702719_g1261_i0:94-1740(-)
MIHLGRTALRLACAALLIIVTMVILLRLYVKSRKVAPTPGTVVAMHFGHGSAISILTHKGWLMYNVPDKFTLLSAGPRWQYLEQLLESVLTPEVRPVSKLLITLPIARLSAPRLHKIKAIVGVDTEVLFPHGLAHALGSFYDSPFSTALAYMSHGTGDDVYAIEFFNCSRVSSSRTDGNRPCRPLAKYLDNPCIVFGTFALQVTKCPDAINPTSNIPSTLMAMASRGTPSNKYSTPIKKAFRLCLGKYRSVVSCARRLWPDATLQVEFVNAHMTILRRVLPLGSRPGAQYEGIVLTGGAAYNIIMNSVIKKATRFPVHVGREPGDAGLTLGMLYAATLPREAPFPPPHLMDVAAVAPALAFASHTLDPIVVGDPYCRKLSKTAASTLVVSELRSGHLVGVARGPKLLGSFTIGNQAILGRPDSTLASRLRALAVSSDPTWITLPEYSRVLFNDNTLVSPNGLFGGARLLNISSHLLQLTNCSVVPVQTVTSHDDSPWLHDLFKMFAKQANEHVLLGVRPPDPQWIGERWKAGALDALWINDTTVCTRK